MNTRVLQENIALGVGIGGMSLFVLSLIVALAYQRFVMRRDVEGAITEGGR